MLTPVNMAHDLPPKGIFPTDDEIADRAYEMIVTGASAPTAVVDYWKLAEAELLERAAARAIRPLITRERRRKHD
jgi:hypothetical protein